MNSVPNRINLNISNLILFLNICRISILCAFTYFATTCSHESIPGILCQAFNAVWWGFLKCSSWDSGPSQVWWRKIHNINFVTISADMNLLLRVNYGGFNLFMHFIRFSRPNNDCRIVCNNCKILELKIPIQINFHLILGPGSWSDSNISLEFIGKPRDRVAVRTFH